VKPKVGCGGAHVTIAHDLVDLVAATSGSDREDLYYEEFVAGTKLDYAAAVSVTGIEQEIAYRILQWEQPVGRATEVQTVEDPQLVDFGRKVIAAAGCTGLVNMDVIRDAQGCDWLIDFNPRAFGASCNFRAAGIDISQGYLRAIGQRTTPPTRRTPIVGTSITIFPTTLDDLIQSGSVVRTAVAFMRQSVPFLRWLGWRYWLSEGLMTAMAVSSARSKRARLVHARAGAQLDTVPS
jgi:predicted ATP-grasp superfamily ATP-dependent carboligase